MNNRKRTDSRLDSILKLLKSYALATPYSPNPFVPYPLHQGHFLMLPGEKEIVILTKENYEERVGKLADVMIDIIKKSDTPITSMFVHISKPYRIQFLQMIEETLTVEEFSELWGWIWTSTEFPHQHPVKLLVRFFEKSNRIMLMEPDDFQVWLDLEGELEIYRGVWSDKKVTVKGLSWTLDRERGEWFAKRFKGENKLYKARIDAQYVFAYFSGRGEKEVVVNPKYLKSLEEIPIG